MDWAVGTDEFGYGYRDVSGEAFHSAIPANYGESYKTGDVIGCLISLDEARNLNDDSNILLSKWPMTQKQENNRVVIKYKGNTFFESRDYSHYDLKSINELQRIPLDASDADTSHRTLRTKNVSKQIKNKLDSQTATSYNKQFKRLVETYPLNALGSNTLF